MTTTDPDGQGFDERAPQLDGHTIEELQAYLEAGRTPVRPDIESSASCRIALAGLERIRELSAIVIDEEADDAPPADRSWIGRVLASLSIEASAGRDVPLPGDPGDVLVVTEGAIRGLLRSVGDATGVFLTGRVRLLGDVTTTDARVRVAVEVDALYGVPLPVETERLRAALFEALGRHTALVVEAIDVTVRDVILPREEPS